MVAVQTILPNFVILQKEKSVIQQDLTSTIEETDICFIPHVNQAIKVKSNNIGMQMMLTS